METTIKSPAQEYTDVFEFIKQTLCCDYISDLRREPYNSKAKDLLEHMSLGGFALHQVSDIYHYIYS